jgi:hypothetical protein
MGDRFPYSGVEFFVLFQAEKELEQIFRSYLYFLFSIFELLITRVGESEFGFRIDQSDGLASPQKFIGTVSEIFEMHVQKIWFETPGVIACSREPELVEEGKSENFAAMLNPELINTDSGGKQLFENYLVVMNNFLETQVDSWTMKAATESLECGVIHKDPAHVLQKVSEGDYKDLEQQDSALTFPLTRHLASLLIWMDILNKINSLEPFKSDTTIDVKLVCYKPLVMLAQCLKVFGNFGTKIKHPSQIFRKAHALGLISFFAFQLLTTMLKTSCKLRARCHKDVNIYSRSSEKIEFSDFLCSEQAFITFCHIIFGRMKNSLSLIICHEGFQKYHSWKSVMVLASQNSCDPQDPIGERDLDDNALATNSRGLVFACTIFVMQQAMYVLEHI